MARQIILEAKIDNTYHHAVIDEFDLVTNGLLRLHKKSNGIANK